MGSDSSWKEGKRVGSRSYRGSEYRDTACPECRNTAFRKYPDGTNDPFALKVVLKGKVKRDGEE
jgi:hypothetical protein